MPKAATQTSTKAAAKTASAKTAKPAKEEKAKRPPSAYNVFMKDTLTGYKANHPDLSHKDAFKAVAAMWKDAPENPNRGQAAPRQKKQSTEDKENAASKPKPKAAKKKVVEQSEEEDDGQLGSDE